MNYKDHRIHKRLDFSSFVMEEIYKAIINVDTVKNIWQLTVPMIPQSIKRLRAAVIVTSTGASNRIEGNNLTDDQVQNLYKNLRIKKFKTRDEQEVAGYLKSLELVFKNYDDIPISESSILQLHHDMLVHSDKDVHHKGQYKTGSNRVEARDWEGNVVQVIFDPTPPYLVKKEMQELFEWYLWAIAARAKHPLILIANFIFEYLAIHPFQDGNGRTSRLLSNLMLLQQGYHFTQVVSHERIIELHKVEYYKALNKTQINWKTEQEDITPWLLFFLSVIKTQSDQALKIMQGDDIEYLLSKKQLALWHWANAKKEEFSRRDAVAALGFPERTVEMIIKKLTNLKRLESLGQGRATRYRLKSPVKPNTGE